ncbi:hypothetical protein ACFQ3P_41875 [Paraburkholderia sabiae]|uniref:Antitoxin Xre/MbcA/ParS-like toxin-binding domain-containing protein n=1 Tax=Paraburkholderia sabiae TaxID=273251 RepID=A0ABU9QRX1_9BURK|nr:hypothetical protein [Paraburkholderia sabiae]WJZ72169.1 hypothetical protein QEN71_18495 [Paraburkholderia sabiae]CAD6563131.1 hypothetical protein LMG24235_08373 [Paraburkholderia sabiae]
MTEIERLAEAASGQYADLERIGCRAVNALRSSDPDLVEGLLATCESENQAGHWLVGRTIGFGGSSALELLAQGKREHVIQVVNHLRFGLCS